MDVKVRSWPTDMGYFTWRGIALHQLLAEMFTAEDWQVLAQLKPKSMEALLLGLGTQTTCQTTQDYLREHREQMGWLAGCARMLLKCLRDWQVQAELVVEPILPVLHLPDGRTLRCGQPDFHAVANAFGGRVNIELKSGWRRIRKHTAKLARYNGGTHVLLQEQQALEPFIGTIWLSFSDCLVEAKTGRLVPRSWPVLNYHFEPFCPTEINRVLAPRFGVVVDDLHALPRSYVYEEDLCAPV